MPKNYIGDYFISLILFIYSHRRIPMNAKLFNDYLFFKKTGSGAKSPLLHYISDKEFVKIYVSGKCGKQYVVPTIAILKSNSEIDDYSFPECCCIKPTHASGRVVFKTDENNVDKKEIKSWLSINYYNFGRESNYRYLEPKIIVEPLIFDSTKVEDYKFFCFKGKVRFIQIDIDRRTNHTRLYFDEDWNELDFSILYGRSLSYMSKPKNLKKMKTIAEDIAADFDFIRVDLYTNGEVIYVGELTNYPENCNGVFVPRESELMASSILFSDVKLNGG